MQLLYDYLPIIFFFIAFKVAGIFWATGIGMLVSTIQVAYSWFKRRHIDKMPLTLWILMIVLGSFTLIFHNPVFIKWKPSVVYWLFAAALIITPFTGKKITALEKMLGKNLSLPGHVWKNLNLAWWIFFLCMGFLNLYVAWAYSTNVWVYFKLFGTLGLTVLLAVIQGFYIYPYINDKPPANDA